MEVFDLGQDMLRERFIAKNVVEHRDTAEIAIIPNVDFSSVNQKDFSFGLLDDGAPNVVFGNGSVRCVARIR